MKEILENSIYFGFFLTIGAYLAGLMLRRKLKLAIFNPLLLAILMIMVFLIFTGVDYEDYEKGGQFVSGLLTPACVPGHPLIPPASSAEKAFGGGSGGDYFRGNHQRSVRIFAVQGIWPGA